MSEYNIKLVGLDIDGTLLNSKNQISPRNHAAIRAAIDAGCRVIPATGRPLRGVLPEFLQIPGVDYAVTANGATVVRLARPGIRDQKLDQPGEGAAALSGDPGPVAGVRCIHRRQRILRAEKSGRCRGMGTPEHGPLHAHEPPAGGEYVGLYCLAGRL